MKSRIKAVGLAIAAALTVFALLIGRQANLAGSSDAAAEPATKVAVTVGKIAKATLHRYVTAYGLIEPEPAAGGKPPASSLVAAPVGGIVAAADCEEGQNIEAGTLLFRLDSRLADAQADKAKAALAFAMKILDRTARLARTEDASRKALEQAEQSVAAARQDLAHAETQRALLKVTSPLRGTVIKVNVRPGEAVGQNTVLVEIVDLDRLIANLAVPASEAGRLKLGQTVEFRTAYYAGNGAEAAPSFHGSIAFIGLQVDAKTATVPVRIALPTESGARPGLFVQARIVAEERRDVLAVPEEAVVTIDGQTFIALVVPPLGGSGAEPPKGGTSNGIEAAQAIRKPVKTGLRDGKWIEIEGDGLNEGMAIVTTGAYGLPEQTRVRIVAREPAP